MAVDGSPTMQMLMSPRAHALGRVLADARQELQEKALLDDLVAVDGGREGLHQARVDVVAVHHGAEIRNLGLRVGCQHRVLSLLDRLGRFDGGSLPVTAADALST